MLLTRQEEGRSAGRRPVTTEKMARFRHRNLAKQPKAEGGFIRVKVGARKKGRSDALTVGVNSPTGWRVLALRKEPGDRGE